MPLARAPEALAVPGHGGVMLNVWDYGGSGAPLILAHCTGTLGRIWDPVVAMLGDQFRILAPDTRGQGDSEAPSNREDYRWEYSGRDLLAIIEHLGLPEGLGAVGHSAGGAHVAYAEHIAPGTFGKAMLIDAVIAERAFFEGENQLAVQVARRKNVLDSIEAARERLTAKPPMQSWVAEAVEAYLEHAFTVDGGGRCHLKCHGTREAWYYELGGASDVYDALGTLHFDVRLVTGEDSYAQHWVEGQHQRLPDARVEVVPGAGHFIPQEKPAETAALIVAWFGSR